MKNPSLLSQVLGINVLLVSLSMFVVSIGGGLTVDAQSLEFLLLILAVATTMLVNAWFLRRRFGPLEKLITTMEAVDLSGNSTRSRSGDSDTAEVARLYRTFHGMLDRLEGERREAGKSVLRAQEVERRRIAQDLHDEVNQALTAVLLRLEATMQQAPEALQHELQETKTLATQAMHELLQIARQLRPTALDDHGLVPALEAQVRDFGERTGIASSFEHVGAEHPLSDDEQLVIYRVAQEGLSNVAQHSGAQRVDVELSFVGRTILKITDDGRGFTGGREGGLGVSGMRERAVLVGGELNLRSQAAGGTTVELVIGG